MIEHRSTIPSRHARQKRIAEMVESQGECLVEKLADEFAVSGMTIRRDLRDLELSGAVIRTHGGAAPSGRVAFDFQFLQRNRLHLSEKMEIARVALGLVRPGQHVFLDSSTTTLAIARQLKTLSRVTVVTTSLPIASELFGLDHVDVILLGGQLRKSAPDLSGPITERAIEVLRGHIAFIGCDAVSDTGAASTDSVQIAQMLGLLAGAAEKRYIVADHTKIGKKALMQFADLRQWDGLITNDQIGRTMLNTLRQSGVNVLTSSDERA